MFLPNPLPAALRGAHLLLLTVLMAGVSQFACAQTPSQRQELAAALRQLDALEHTVASSAANASASPGDRYHFDYPRLQDDLARVRAGIRDYLVPQRAQPREPAPLAGDYVRTDSTSRTAAEASKP